MPFTSTDEKINKSGRPKGSMNKATAEIRERYLQLIQNNFETLENDLKALRSAERIKAIIELSKFILPTLKATEVEVSTSNNFQPITIEWKSEKEFN
tara:strand:- start:1863 stop:2153 length:291 start_codon:yes stop_codon:yes gene_type:complete